ncbi:MAG TPA: 3-hydroxyacyl-CoA dehydrogenase/enoyl-CoA hydratase family protein [Anaerolineae bacterium]|jgi:3-hydroxyacyl-CoA dehydrogenase|nr:3-hydroxyacyl-CoA dehydrogenase/enoyl-CoA hydratase family protein [Anaerolineae bacterium]
MTFRIDKVAIIGAGTMGGGIAAHLANIGIDVVLLDIVTPNLDETQKSDRRARNRLVKGLYDRMLKAKPANLARPDRAAHITIGNIDDDFEKVADCDWIIEAIIEQLAPKQKLMARIEEVRKPGSIISSNTSGIPIQQIAAGRSDDFKAHFLGTHFFNPPRYLRLLELIPTQETGPEVLDFMLGFGRDVLGKGVVVCKDTPNFIGNRFFTIAASYSIDYAFQNGYTVAEIDAITGPLIGRPKSATFRLMDLVGLDIMGHVNSNLYGAIPDDPYREVLRQEKTSAVMATMIKNGWLGNKSGQGFYKKTFVDGKREFWTINPETLEYEPPEKVRFTSVGAVRKIEDLDERLPALLEQEPDRAVTYVRDTLLYMLSYAAHVAPEIAYRLSDVDAAVRWGFAHEAGPFEMWDMLGVADTAEQMEVAGLEVAPWVKQMLAAGYQSFYQEDCYYDFANKQYEPLPVDDKAISIELLRKSGGEVKRNMSASLLDMGDGVALLEMHAPKINAVDADFIQMIGVALERLETDFEALVIGNTGQDFCIGANIAMLAFAAAQGLWDQIDEMLRGGQEAFFKLRHAPKPVVTAPHQRVLGGGVELTVASWATVADHETYMGLVEVGVGIVPSWGGCTEVIRRKINPVMRTPNADVVPVMEDVFDQIATAKIGVSAWESKTLGYLRPDDQIVMNTDHRLAAAKHEALALVASGIRPPEVEQIYAAGRDVLSALELRLQTYAWAGYASEHDQKVGKKLAGVLCGGDISGPTWVDPWYMLDLEREATLSLAGEKKTQDRIVHMLQKGKPLRN